jgi:hypothetical protein
LPSQGAPLEREAGGRERERRAKGTAPVLVKGRRRLWALL